jgi:CheY-like chemotaxis protein
MDDIDFTGKTIMLVDDEADIREIIASELSFLGANILEADNITSAFNIFEKENPDLIISDIRMPGGTGIELLDLVKKKRPDLPFVLVTGFADISLENALDKGSEALLNKPFKLEELIHTSQRLLSPFESRFSQKNQHLNPEIVVDTSHAVRLGRGGVMLELDPQKFQPNPGEGIKFDLSFSNITLKGIGICRWVRQNPNTSSVSVGLEFMDLDLQSLQSLKKFFSENFIIPFVPKAKI